MKTRIYIFLLLFVSVLGYSQEAAVVKWYTVEEALAIQAKEGAKARPIFMDVYTNWCGPCKMLDKNTFSDPAVATLLNTKYIAVKFNAEGQIKFTYNGTTYSNPNFNPDRKGRNSVHQFTNFLELEGYPTMVIIDPNFKKREMIVGYYSAAELLERI